jgi:cytochrome P450
MNMYIFPCHSGETNAQLGVHQEAFARTLVPESCPAGLFTYAALGIRRIVPFTPSAVSYFSNSRNYVKTEITRNVLRRLSGEGLLVVDGAEHRRQRKLVNPAFTAERIKLLVPVFWTKACELRKLWHDEGVNAEEYDVFSSLVRTTLDIIGLAGYLISCV